MINERESQEDPQSQQDTKSSKDQDAARSQKKAKVWGSRPTDVLFVILFLMHVVMLACHLRCFICMFMLACHLTLTHKVEAPELALLRA